MKLRIMYYNLTIVFFLLLCSLGYTAVNSRLVLVENTLNSPSPGLGTLVIDVEAISDNGSVQIGIYQTAIQLNSVLKAQVPPSGITFSNQRFATELVPGVPIYDSTTEDYIPGQGRVRLAYLITNASLLPFANTIEASYTTVVRITIQYEMGSGSGAIDWSTGNPQYLVAGNEDPPNTITGNEETVSFLLTDITLPVELSAFSAQAAEGKVVLSWATQSEVNNLGFEVYRAQEEAGNYTMIASYESNAALQGAGNSNEEIEYQYEDASIYPGATFWYQIADVDFAGVRTFHGPIQAEALETLPTAYALRNNYPNPFNPSTTIRFEVPANVNDRMEIVVYNALGMKLKTLVSGRVEAGVHEVVWDGTNQQGVQMASGVYFIRMLAGKFNKVHKMILLK